MILSLDISNLFLSDSFKIFISHLFLPHWNMCQVASSTVFYIVINILKGPQS